MTDFMVLEHRLQLAGQPVLFRQSPHGGGAMPEPTLIVIHETASPLVPGAAVAHLTDPRAGVSAHLVIERDGSVAQLMPFDRVAWHAGKSRWRGRSNCNAFSIGIELVGPGRMQPIRPDDDSRALSWWGKILTGDLVRDRQPAFGGEALWMPFTPAQLDACFGVCQALAAHYGITAVAGHYEISPGRKTDPGPLFPIQRLRDRLAGRGDEVEAPGQLVMALPGAVIRRWPAGTSTPLPPRDPRAPLTILRSLVADDRRWHLVSAPALEGTALEGWILATDTRPA